MHDLFPIPSCFSPAEKPSEDLIPAAVSATRSWQSLVVSAYRTNLAGHCSCLITVTWCKNLLTHCLSISMEGLDDEINNRKQHNCKVQISPWHLWRNKHGSHRFQVEGATVDVFWDLNNAKFCSETEPQSDYYVAVVFQGEVILLLGDLKKEAYRRAGSRPSLIEAILVSKKEHALGKKRFSTRSKFHEKGKCHEISVECSSSSISSNMDLDMVIKIDGNVAIHVRHLQWKFRGNGSISINKHRVEVYWDAHDWIFSPGLRHALFIFKPEASTSSATSSCSFNSAEGGAGKEGDSCSFCLFLYAWKID